MAPSSHWQHGCHGGARGCDGGSSCCSFALIPTADPSLCEAVTTVTLTETRGPPAEPPSSVCARPRSARTRPAFVNPVCCGRGGGGCWGGVVIHLQIRCNSDKFGWKCAFAVSSQSEEVVAFASNKRCDANGAEDASALCWRRSLQSCKQSADRRHFTPTSQPHVSLVFLSLIWTGFVPQRPV